MEPLTDVTLDTEVQVRRQELPTPQFTICALLYGDHLRLARRCLIPILELLDSNLPIELRIGMNEVSEEVDSYVRKLFLEESTKHEVKLYSSTHNRGKYPMMRWMLHDPNFPVKSLYTMWFDDDSFIRSPTRKWLDHVRQTMDQGVDMCGELMQCNLAGNQPIWIMMQPWFNGKPLERSASGQYHVHMFVVGGWWTITTKTIKKLDWPPTNIVHRGGDVMLGEAMRQHDFKLTRFTEGLGINADEHGISHKAPRRGLDPPPVGVVYEPPLTARLHYATKDIDPRLLDYPGL